MTAAATGCRRCHVLPDPRCAIPALQAAHPLLARISPCMEHPHGVQPALGLFEDDGEGRSVRAAGLGLLAPLPDEALLAVLEQLPARDLARLACTSRFLWAFCQHDELWKAFCLEVGGRGNVSSWPVRRAEERARGKSAAGRPPACPLLAACRARPVPPRPACRSWRAGGTSSPAGRTRTLLARCPATGWAHASRARLRACSQTCYTHPGCEWGWGKVGGRAVVKRSPPRGPSGRLALRVPLQVLVGHCSAGLLATAP